MKVQVGRMAGWWGGDSVMTLLLLINYRACFSYSYHTSEIVHA